MSRSTARRVAVAIASWQTRRQRRRGTVSVTAISFILRMQDNVHLQYNTIFKKHRLIHSLTIGYPIQKSDNALVMPLGFRWLILFVEEFPLQPNEYGKFCAADHVRNTETGTGTIDEGLPNNQHGGPAGSSILTGALSADLEVKLADIDVFGCRVSDE
ncbi:hypothetical protein EVAR_62042_1 [Eumeta japonica]|uniref:Uncharacterized protein n=1 Tax=Eumeta variegata TaxID=151549 RepID=A0A4C1YTI0_EUMVA|nr:hypothetical protein EVAR_62042_1 [Eumeta japonica]